MEKSREWAERSVAGYAAGHKEASRAYARPGIDKSVDKQLLGKAGEVAHCLYFNIDPNILDWGPRCDPGWDVVQMRMKIDIKSTDTAYLMWPVPKNVFVPTADIFSLACRLDGRGGARYEMSGWFSRKAFLMRRKIAPPPEWMDPNTKHVHKDHLWPIWGMLATLYRRRENCALCIDCGEPVEHGDICRDCTAPQGMTA
jgi:hypothetical protein